MLALQSTVLDPAAVERDVAAQFEQREGVAIELHCADDMEVKKGATYECTGTTADGESVTLQIAITDETDRGLHLDRALSRLSPARPPASRAPRRAA